MVRFSVSVRHDYDDAPEAIRRVEDGLGVAVSEGTRDAVELVRRAVVEQVTRRTTMGPPIAEAITKTDLSASAESARGLIRFEEKAGKYPIRPKNKKALFWPGARHPVAGVMHPYSRPWKLLPAGAEGAWPGVKNGYEDRIDDALREVS